MDWILASASPRRKELLAELIDTFAVIPSAFDENVGEDFSSPQALVEALAIGKALDVANRKVAFGKIVLGSDTVVVYEGATPFASSSDLLLYGKDGEEYRVLGKPKDSADATRMLKMLSGKRHYVYTGVCLACVGTERKILSATEGTAVHFCALSDEWIEAYVNTGSPLDKAGAYGIQDGGLVEKIEGSYSNVVGLPTELTARLIEKIRTDWNIK